MLPPDARPPASAPVHDLGAGAAELPASPLALFLAFNALALQGFGGVIAVAQRVLVEQRRWLTRGEFVELLAVAQVLPGPNVCNLALMIGDRHFGLRGAFAALGGMMLVPLVLVIVLAALYGHFAHVPQVAGALKGMGAVAAGLIIGTAIKLAGALRASPLGVPLCAVVGAAAFVLVALARWPLVGVLLCCGGSAVVWAYVRMARA